MLADCVVLGAGCVSTRTWLRMEMGMRNEELEVTGAGRAAVSGALE